SLRKTGISLATAVLLSACGSEDSPYSAPGIESGSASAAYNSGTDPAGIPEIGAALRGQLDDDFEAIRFLHRASFGPTTASIDQLMSSDVADYVEQQLQMEPTFLLPITRQRSEPRWLEHINSWLKNSVNAPDQLRQRVAYALSQFFVVSGEGELGQHPTALANYYDILVAGSFGNFRDLMEQVTLSPVMGNYLSMKGNQKADAENKIHPDENYARELLQLFSIGLVELNLNGMQVVDDNNNPVPTYDQETVENFARVFTGWHFKDVDDWDYPSVEDWYHQMQPYEDKHDKEAKTLLNGLNIPAGQTARQDLEAALDNIFNHKNVGPFVSKHLISQLVTSNPSPEYVERVASVFNKDGNGQRGNLAAVVVAILFDDEAMNGYLQDPNNFGKLREPLVRLVSLWRGFGANPDHPDFDYTWIKNRLSQAPLQSPSVFNFFSPRYSQPGMLRDQGMVSPEFQIHNESSMVSITSTLLAHSIWRNNFSDADPAMAPIDISTLARLDGDTQAQFQYLSRLTLGKPMSDALLAQALYLLDERQNANAQIRSEELLFLFLSSPEAAVQR
ncbi:MAG: DUF1800 family protein, partial [Pseudomonadota bacterium]